MNKKILITGSKGLVGSALNEIKNDYSNYEFIFHSRNDCDLMNWDKTLNYFFTIKPYYVIHLAANVGGLYKNIKNKVAMLEDNILINHNVIKACHIIGVNKLISCLSTCIFPDNIKYPINEDMLHEGEPHETNYAYAYAKRLMEIHTRTYNEQYDHNYICIIPTNIYGPNDNYNLEDGHVIPSLIHKCYLAKLNNTDFIISGTGKPLRQFIYSIDLAKIIMLLLLFYNDKSNIIISPKIEISIKDIVNIIANKFNYIHKIKYDISKSDGQFRKTVDNSKLLLILSLLSIDFKFTDINDGINNTIDWFISNYETCRK